MTLFGSGSDEQPFKSNRIYGWGLLENALNINNAEDNSLIRNWGSTKYNNFANA